MNIANLPIGAKVQFGMHSLQGRPPAEIVWIKLSEENDFCTAGVIEHALFDQKEHHSLNRSYQLHGNNCYSESNIDQYLNSTEANWFKPAHDFDTPPNSNDEPVPMSLRPGFLHYFQQYELDLMEPRTITCSVPYGRKKDFSSNIVISRKVSLPSFSEFTKNAKDRTEGACFPYIDQRDENEQMFFPGSSDEYRQRFRVSTAYAPIVLTRTAMSGSPSKIITVASSGNTHLATNDSPFRTRAIIPVIRISGNAELADLAEGETVWVLKQALTESDQVVTDLMTILSH